jgi:gamma-glutamyltranspeptidase/glutathione hydrolase
LARFGQRWKSPAEEIGAANALVCNADGTVTAVGESKRHGTGTALV